MSSAPSSRCTASRGTTTTRETTTEGTRTPTPWLRATESEAPGRYAPAMAAPVTKGEELELSVESLAYGGNGVARHDGFVVFVRRGLPGDRVRARVTKVKRGFAEALAT